MIEINLLPEELKKKEPRFKKFDIASFNLQGLPFMKISIAAAALLIALHITLYLVGTFASSSLSALSKKYDEILPKRQEADKLKARLENMDRRVKAIDALMLKRFSWAGKLNYLSDSMTPGIWLSELDYDETSNSRPFDRIAADVNAGKQKGQMARPLTLKTAARYLIISGYASSLGEEGTALIGKFIKSLKGNDGFYSDMSDIELKSIKSDKVAGQEVMSFRISCLFKNGALTKEER